MSAALRFAEGGADHESIYRLRYDIYVEEMGYVFPGVDHQCRRLAEAFTRPTRLLMAEEGGALVGTLQFSWGAECVFVVLDGAVEVMRGKSIALLTRGGVRRDRVPARYRAHRGCRGGG